jgi:low affinity Fe/Cu permease
VPRRLPRNAKSASTSQKSASTPPRNHVTAQGWFEWFACGVAHLSGKPVTFLLAAATVIVWAATGPVFHYSDTWQLVINTGTTIVTFLMVFLIQNTQNRDTMALQIKLAELIIAMRGAKNKMAIAEDMTEEDLQRLHRQYRKHAEEALGHLERKRAARAGKAA